MNNNKMFLLLALFGLTISLNAMHDHWDMPHHRANHIGDSQFKLFLLNPGSPLKQAELYKIAEWNKFENECSTAQSPSYSCFMLPAGAALVALCSTVAGCALLKLAKELETMPNYHDDSKVERRALVAARYGLKSLAFGCLVVGYCSVNTAEVMSIDLYRRMNS